MNKILIELDAKEIAELQNLEDSKGRLNDDKRVARIQICDAFKEMTHNLIKHNTLCNMKDPELIRVSKECVQLIMDLAI